MCTVPFNVDHLQYQIFLSRSHCHWFCFLQTYFQGLIGFRMIVCSCRCYRHRSSTFPESQYERNSAEVQFVSALLNSLFIKSTNFCREPLENFWSEIKTSTVNSMFLTFCVKMFWFASNMSEDARTFPFLTQFLVLREQCVSYWRRE
jgi:hypothetical protein